MFLPAYYPRSNHIINILNNLFTCEISKVAFFAPVSTLPRAILQCFFAKHLYYRVYRKRISLLFPNQVSASF